MRRFFNILLFFAISTTANATTIVRPYGASDYAGGAKAVGSKVDSEFDTIVNWLNGGNIASGNIAAFGVLKTNLSIANLKSTAGSGLFQMTTGNNATSDHEPFHDDYYFRKTRCCVASGTADRTACESCDHKRWLYFAIYQR